MKYEIFNVFKERGYGFDLQTMSGDLEQVLQYINENEHLTLVQVVGKGTAPSGVGYYTVIAENREDEVEVEEVEEEVEDQTFEIEE